VSVKDAARLTSMSEKVVRDEVNAGRIPAVRYGTRIVIDYAGLIDWFRSHPPVVDMSA
jgi:excisionase family DNA binding protein